MAGSRRTPGLVSWLLPCLLAGGCIDVASLGAPCDDDSDCSDGLRCAEADGIGVCASRRLPSGEGEGEGEGEPCSLRDVLLADETAGRAAVATDGTVVAAAFSATTLAPTRGGSVSFRIEGIGNGAIIDSDTIASSADATMLVDGLAWSDALQRFGLLFHEEPAIDRHRGLRLATFAANGNVSGVDEVFPAASTGVTAYLLPTETGFLVVHEARLSGDTFGAGVIAVDDTGPTLLDPINADGALFGTPVAGDDGVFVAWSSASDPSTRVRVARIAGTVVTPTALTVDASADVVAAQVIADGTSVRLLHRLVSGTTSTLCVLPGCTSPTTVALQLDNFGLPSVAIGRRGATLALTEDLVDSTSPASVVTLDLDDGAVVQRKRWSDNHASFRGSVAVLDGVGLMAGSTDDAQPSRELRLIISCDRSAW